jgi:ankyrin repeat protein
MNAMISLLFLLFAGMIVKSSEYEWTDVESDSEWNKIEKARKVVQETTKRLDNAQREYQNFLNQPAEMQSSESESTDVERLRDQVHKTTKSYDDYQRKYQNSFNQLLRKEKFLKFVNEQKGKKQYQMMNFAINCVDVLQEVESYLEPRETFQMKLTSEKLNRLKITRNLNLFPNESSVQMFRDIEFLDVIIWSDPNVLISNERKENLEKCMRHVKLEKPSCLFDEVCMKLANRKKENCLFDEVSEWDPVAETYPFFKEVLFATLKVVDLERKNRTIKILLLNAIDFNAPKDVLRLIEQKEGVNLEESIYIQGYKPLAYAARENRLEIATILLDAGAEVNGLTQYHYSPLYAAARFGHVEMVELLLGNNANVDSRDFWGQTPLYRASETERVEIVKLLLDAGADVNSKNMYNQTPIHQAAFNGRVENLKLLLARGADANVQESDWTPLIMAIANVPNVEIVQILVGLKVSLDFQSSMGETALIIAAGYGEVEIVKILLEAGANTEKTATYERRDSFGKTAAQIALQRGHQNVADAIIDFKNSALN